MSLQRCHQDALAAITELFHHDHADTAESIERAREVVAGQTVTELRETTIGAAWFAAVALRTIDAIKPGAGLEMLQQFGLILAQEAR